MRNIILIATILFCLYGNTWAYTNTSGISFCPGNTGSTSGKKQIPVTINTTAPSSGSVSCAEHGYYGGILRPGGSWIAQGVSYTCPDNEFASSRSCRQGSTDVSCTSDGTGWDRYKVFCKFRDDTLPSASDITTYGPTVLDRQAVDDQSVYVDVGVNSGAPIALIQGYFENEGPTHNTYYRESSNTDRNPANLSRLQVFWDMSKVDNDGSINNGKRQYNFFISYIEDEAGNSIGIQNSSATTIWNRDYQVHANAYDLGTTSVTSNELDDGGNIADGVQKEITINLEDTYGNKIIPVADIGRTIDFNISMDNQLRLDQYLNNTTGNNLSAVFVGDTDTEIRVGNSAVPEDDSLFEALTGTSSLYNTSAKDYTIPFYIYAPTNNTNSQLPGYASMSSISFDINDSTLGDYPGNLITNTSFDLVARPRYWGSLTGEVRDQGLIEGAVQNSLYTVTPIGSASVLSPSTRFEYGAVSGTINIENPRFDIEVGRTSATRVSLNEGTQGALIGIININNAISTTPISSLMTLQGGGVITETHSYLASILEFTLLGKQVVYPTDIIGKDSYHSTAGALNSYQEGIKITGNTSSESVEEITVDQFTDDIRVLGKLTKSTFRRDINQKAFSVTRNIEKSVTDGSNGVGNVGNLGNPTKWTSSSNDGLRIYGDQVLFFRGQDVTISQDTIVGNKTLLVEGGDIYISGDITGAGLLGIIAIDGDILIRNTVTDIHAILYTNRSIISTTNGTDRLDGNSSATFLENQLYIHGSLFSENTIGGSRKSTPECPYYINSVCDQVEAQTYDLNYLRRYYMYDALPAGALDGIPDTPSGAQSLANGQLGFENFPVIIDYNTAIQETPPPFFD